jgi:hypothetical protein
MKLPLILAGLLAVASLPSRAETASIGNGVWSWESEGGLLEGDLNRPIPAGASSVQISLVVSHGVVCGQYSSVTYGGKISSFNLIGSELRGVVFVYHSNGYTGDADDIAEAVLFGNKNSLKWKMTTRGKMADYVFDDVDLGPVQTKTGELRDLQQKCDLVSKVVGTINESKARDALAILDRD